MTAPPVAVIVGSTWAFDLESTDEFSSRGFVLILVVALLIVVALVVSPSASGLRMSPLSKYRLVLLDPVVAPFRVRILLEPRRIARPLLLYPSRQDPHHLPVSSYGLSPLLSWLLVVPVFLQPLQSLLCLPGCCCCCCCCCCLWMLWMMLFLPSGWRRLQTQGHQQHQTQTQTTTTARMAG